MTIYAGIDVGSLTAEAVLLDHTSASVLASAQLPVCPDPVASAREVLDTALAALGRGARMVARAVATGYGREMVVQAGLAQTHVSEISCHGYGAFCLAPEVRTVVDVGGQDAKAIRVDGQGDLATFAMNDKCAAGTGHFLELMCRCLEVELPQLGPLALGARAPMAVSSRCSIFIETEVVHFLQRGIDRADLAAGICQAMADRVVALTRRVKPVPEVVMTGGVAKNAAVRREIEKRLGLRLTNLRMDPQLVGAYGAARLARRQGGAGR